MVELQTRKKIKCLRIDSFGDFFLINLIDYVNIVVVIDKRQLYIYHIIMEFQKK
jgi:hypothetical protein